MKHTVYLSGPMGGCTYEEMTGWRHKAANALNSNRVEVIDPTRSFTAKRVPNETERWVNRRDFNDCTKASVVLVNFVGMKKLSIGTIMEIAWAYQKHIPIVAICESDGPQNHPMLKDSITQEARTLEEGIALVKELLSEDVDYSKIHWTINEKPDILE